MFVNMVNLKIPPYCNFFIHKVFLFTKKYSLVDEFCTSFIHSMKKIPKLLVISNPNLVCKNFVQIRREVTQCSKVNVIDLTKIIKHNVLHMVIGKYS